MWFPTIESVAALGFNVLGMNQQIPDPETAITPRHAIRQSTLLTTLIAVAILVMAVAQAAPPTGADQPTVNQLQKQVDALSQELTQLQNATDPATKQSAMQQHWSMAQEHMRTLRMMPGMGARGCGDWMMMDPSMMGPGMMGPNGAAGCSMMDHGMMGPGTMGQGMPGWWGMPSSMSPMMYGSQMQGHMQQMHKQMAAITAEKNPAKRQALIREHYKTMYRDMQTMRGMGWMWAPNATTSLPEADSQGARLVGKYCSQCHAVPSPSLHTQAEWSGVTSRMREHLDRMSQPNSATTGLKIPSATELDLIDAYLGKYALAAR